MFFFFAQHLFSQNFSLKGEVLTDDYTPIPHAIVTVFQNEKLTSFGNSNQEGLFLLKLDQPGDYQIRIRKMGYFDVDADISIDPSQTEYDLGTVFMTSNSVDLEQLVIVGNPSGKRDTVEYLATDYAKNFELSVEDLLKEIPGVEVDITGRIKVNGDDVSFVLVEGDDLFSEGYQILTQNMPSQPVESVQIIQDYSKNQILGGIQKSGVQVINLKLKEKEKGKWSGTAELASTSYVEQMHQIKLNLMNFKQDRKFYLFFNYNNLGLEEMKGVEYLLRPTYSRNVENVGELLQQNTSLIRLNPIGLLVEDNRDNFNDDYLGAINFIQNFPQDFKVHFLSIFNKTERNRYVENIQVFDFDETNFTNEESKHWNLVSYNSISKLELDKQFKNSALNFTNKIYVQKEQNENQFIFNGLNAPQNGEGNLVKLDHQLNFTQKLDSITALAFVGRFVHSGQKFGFTESSDFFANYFQDENIQMVQENLENKSNFLGIKTSYLKNYKKDQNLEIQLGSEWNRNHFQSQLQSFDQEVWASQEGFHNDLEFNIWNLYSKIKYTQPFKRRWKLDFQLDLDYFETQWNQLGISDETSIFYMSPGVNLSYERMRFGNLSLGYQRRISPLSENHLYRNLIYLGDRDFRANDMKFSALSSHNLNLSYEKGNVNKGFKIFSMFNYNDEYFSTESIIQPEFNYTVNVLMKDNYYFHSELEIYRFFQFLKSRLSLTGSFGASEFSNRINEGNLRENRQETTGLKISWKTGWIGKLNFRANYKLDWIRFKSNQFQANYRNEFFDVNLHYTFSPKFRIESRFEILNYGNTNQNLISFWDIKLNYRPAQSNIHFYLNLNNLLNQKHIERYTVDNISETYFRQRLIPLHIVLGCRFNLF